MVPPHDSKLLPRHRMAFQSYQQRAVQDVCCERIASSSIATERQRRQFRKWKCSSFACYSAALLYGPPLQLINYISGNTFTLHNQHCSTYCFHFPSLKCKLNRRCGEKRTTKATVCQGVCRSFVVDFVDIDGSVRGTSHAFADRLVVVCYTRRRKLIDHNVKQKYLRFYYLRRHLSAGGLGAKKGIKM